MSDEKLPPEGFVLGVNWTNIAGNLANSWFCCHRIGRASCQSRARYVNTTEDRASPLWLAGSCSAHAEAMGAIVRKAEAPTFEQLVEKVGPLESNAMATAETPTCEWLIPTGETLGGSLAGVHVGRKCPEPRIDGDELCALHARRRPAAEQLSGNTGGLPAPPSFVCMAETAYGVCAMRKGHKGEHDLFFASTRPAEAPAAPVAEPTADPERMEALRAIVDSNNGKHAAIAERDARIAALEAELDEANDRRDHEWYARLQPAVEVAVQAERERCAFHVKSAVNKSIGYRTALERIKNGDPAP